MTIQEFDKLNWENIIKLRVTYKGKERIAVHYCRTAKEIGLKREEGVGVDWVSCFDVNL